MEHEKSAAIEQVLGCGLFQALTYLSSQWVVFVQAWNHIFMVFNKVEPKWTCWDAYDNATANATLGAISRQEACIIKQGCKNLTFEYDFYSIATQWDLTCDRAKIVYLIMTIQMIGILISAPVFGQLSDSFGRKWTLLFCIIGNIAFGATSALSTNWQIYAVFRFIIGFFCGGSIIINFVLFVEFLTKKHRLWVISFAGWPIAFMVMSLLAYLTKDWRTLTVTMNLLGLPSLGLIMYIGESPRWQLRAGRNSQADVQLRRVMRINRQGDSKEKALNAIFDINEGGREPFLRQAATEKTAQLSYWHLFTQSKQMAVYTAVLSICYFCVSAISYGITFTVDKFSGSIYMNFFYMACLRWVGNILTIVADAFIKKFGRKAGVTVPFLCVTVASTVVVLLHTTNPQMASLNLIISIILLSCGALCSPIWIEMGLANNELFPTPIRGIAVAFCSTWNRLGSVAMPQILYLALFWKPAPYVVFLVLSLVAAIGFGLFVPESKDKPLPQKMPEKSRLTKNQISMAQCTALV